MCLVKQRSSAQCEADAAKDFPGYADGLVAYFESLRNTLEPPSDDRAAEPESSEAKAEAEPSLLSSPRKRTVRTPNHAPCRYVDGCFLIIKNNHALFRLKGCGAAKKHPIIFCLFVSLPGVYCLVSCGDPAPSRTT